ncbi:ferritin-like domain-containing protein [Runella sp.]|uniref:ferritin-like domain-containing protein n=1 Tax=Runella sp. TaxID=1960881 RepID=UPI003D1304E8
MNLFNILSDIEKIDVDANERYTFTRRKMLKTTTIAAAATSTLFAGVVNKAFAATPEINEVLNFALLLEYLEAEFYTKGINSGLNFGISKGLFEEIAKHENQHVALLKSALGAAAIAKPVFDFTAKGAFPDPFTNYPVFLTLAQAFEDTGVRAYKGQAPKLASNRDILETALRIHSVEARHAGEIRLVRELTPYANEGNNGSGNGGVPAAVYAGENNIYHMNGIDLISLTTPKFLDSMRAEKVVRESFDEPLTKEQVTAIAMPFIKSM